MDKVDLGASAELDEVEVGFVEFIMPGEAAGDHAGVRGVRKSGDESDTARGQRLVPERAQHGDMGVSAAEKHEVFGISHER